MQVAQPLQKLMSGKNAGKKKVAIALNGQCQQSLYDLKHLCTMASILAYTDFMKHFKLHTNACGSVLGSVLYQTHEDGTDAVITYTSRNLTKLKLTTQPINCSFSHSSGPWLRNSMSIFTGQPLMYILITTTSCGY